MFAPYCPVHQSRVLLFADNIEGLRVEDDSVVVDYHCNCGFRGTWHAGNDRQTAPAA